MFCSEKGTSGCQNIDRYQIEGCVFKNLCTY